MVAGAKGKYILRRPPIGAPALPAQPHRDETIKLPHVTQEMSDAMVRKGASMARAQDRHRISRYGNLIKLLPGRAVGLCRCHDTCATLRGY
jgi:hypothetical protein